MEIEQRKIKSKPLKRINYRKIKKNNDGNRSRFDQLDENYFKEYDICIHGNEFKSDRYIRLSESKFNELNIRKPKKKIKKKGEREEYKNYFEFQYPSETIAKIKKNDSIKNFSNQVKSKVYDNFRSIYIPHLNKNIEKSNDDNNISLPLVDKTNIKNNQNQNNHINKKVKFINDNTRKNENQSTLNETKINSKNNVSSKKKKLNENNILDYSNRLSFENRDEYFSTDLLLFKDNEDIFHINEDLFSKEQQNDVLVLEKYNYNITDSKYLENLKSKKKIENDQEEINMSKEKLEEEDKNDNKINVYNTSRRANMKKIANVIEITKNMTRRKSIYTNFDYSDEEYDDTSSNYSSSSESYKQNRKQIKNNKNYNNINNSITKLDVRLHTNSLDNKDINEIKHESNSSITKPNIRNHTNLLKNNENNNDEVMKSESLVEQNEIDKIKKSSIGESKIDVPIEQDNPGIKFIIYYFH